MSREIPILFSAPMVRAILSGAKTQTRRILKQQPDYRGSDGCESDPDGWGWENDMGDHVPVRSARVRWAVGDRLWVRETWCAVNDTAYGGEKWVDYRATPKFNADHPAGWENDPSDPIALKWRPSIFMPRWASRITLDVTGVRVERLQDITEADAVAEGCGWLDTGNSADNDLLVGDPVPTYSRLWDHINGAGSWDANPWVVAIEFRRVAGDV